MSSSFALTDPKLSQWSNVHMDMDTEAAGMGQGAGPGPQGLHKGYQQPTPVVQVPPFIYHAPQRGCNLQTRPTEIASETSLHGTSAIKSSA